MSDTWWVDKEDLLEEQLNVLGVGLDKDLYISGPPGSGKTNLLLLRANHLAIANPSAEFYIVCYTGLLVKFIRTGADIYKFPANRIVTKQHLYESILGDHGLLPAGIRGMTIKERATQVEQAMKTLKAMGIGKYSFPMLLIDEAQDYPGEDLDMFCHLAKNVSCAADGRQGLYKEGASSTKWINDYPWHETVRLVHHYRTAPNIIEIADKIMTGKLGHIPMLPTHEYKGDITPVECFGGLDLAGQVELAEARILKQIDIYPGQKIGVIVPRKEDLNQVWSLLSSSKVLVGKITNAKDQDFDSVRPVWVSTMHSAKGLEFRCVHILAADGVKKFNEHSRRLAFTGVTRAKTSLSIYHDQELLPFFSSALAEKTAKRVTLDHVFGKKP